MAQVHFIDASPYIFRAFFSLPDSIRTNEGRPANATYGFASFLLAYLDQEKPTHVAVTFDESLNTSFRNEIFPDYKAQRELPPADLEAQLKDCQRVAAALGFATFVDHRYEADDIIATLLGPLCAEGHTAVIVTSDKDLAQLVCDGVSLYDFARGTRMSATEVAEKFGVRPDQIVDYLALAGDPVDNIPGVRGVGPKTAAQLLRLFGSLDGIYENLRAVLSAGEIRGAKSVEKKLRDAKEIAYLSKRLATVSPDAPSKATLDELQYRGADRDAVDALFGELGFGTIASRIARWNA